MKQEIALGIMKAGRNVFLTGSAGTGKTYVLNQYIQYLKERKIKPSIVAPTGIAASHIGGSTIHSFFGIGIKEKISDYDLEFLIQKKYLHDRFSKLKVLIIDEVSMLSPDLFETMDKILRAFKFSNQPFGGVQLILSGDFFQLPPVSKEWKEKRFIWQTELWDRLDLKIAYLEEKFRQDDGKLIEILDEIRSGGVSQRTWELLEKKIKEEKKDLKIKPTRLYTHNLDVDRINQEELDKIENESHYFEAVEKGSRKNLERIYKSSLVKENLELKKTSVVIFIKNNYEKGYINGTIGVIVDFEDNLPIVELASGRRIKLEREEWTIEDDKGNVKAVVKQIPLRLAWAITIHKSQGMTLDMAEIDLSKTFELGQGYVALSRIRTFDGLFLKGINPMALQVDLSVLSNDEKFKRFSRVVEKKFLAFNEEEKKEMYQNFILKLGGSIDLKEIEEERKKIEKEEKGELEMIENTYQKTQELVLKKKQIEEMIEERSLSEDTIIKHLKILLKNNQIEKKDLEYLKIDKDMVEAVREVVEEILKDKKEENFTQDGEIKLKPIFEMLDSEVDYQNIKKALLFLL